jgi:hypothetical protein
MLTRKEYVKVLEELHSTGMNLSRLSNAIGLEASTLIAAKTRNVMYGDVTKLAQLLRGKAKLLKSYHPKKHSLEYICDEAYIKQSSIAKQMGVSRQALNKSIDHLPEARVSTIQGIVRGIGTEIDSLAGQLEKIKD